MGKYQCTALDILNDGYPLIFTVYRYSQLLASVLANPTIAIVISLSS